MTKDLTAQITKNIQVVIAPLSPDVALDKPLIAVNWFNTRSLSLYNIYNALASRSVAKVGGQVIIKGKINQVFAGEPKDRRDVLLIVQYPSGSQFMSMMQSTYFKLVSMLRAAAVSKFAFGFTQPTTQATAEADPQKDMAYVFHHYRGEDYGPALAQLASEHSVKVIYAGQAAATLATRKADAQDNPVPSFWEGVLVFQARSKTKLTDFVNSESFQELTRRADASFSASFDRLL